QPPPLVTQRKPWAIAFEQSASEGFFQRTDMAADGALGQRQFLRSTCK
ncbi:hypothetical protein PSYAC_29021, partial [Pseudomonas syringae pv. actinidiae str. M302091]